MHIEIAERLRPFSHQPGSYAMLPGSPWRLQVFPALLRIDDLSGTTPQPLIQIAFDVEGPLDDFTIQQDLEKGFVRVWGHAPAGFFRYRLAALSDGQGIMMHLEKAPACGVVCSSDGLWHLDGNQPAHAGDILLIKTKNVKVEYCKVPEIDRLSLGNHKAQDWNLIQRRCDFMEIFPHWHRLGQLVSAPLGKCALFDECCRAIESHRPETILPAFRKLFLHCFDPGFAPRLHDTDFNGIKLPAIKEKEISPLLILSEGAKLIRSLFVQTKDDHVQVLPALPPEFHCGRLLNVLCGDIGILSVEWTKKAVRIMTFHSKSTQKCLFKFFGDEKRCRLRTSHVDRGMRYEKGDVIDLVAGKNYWFDNFER